MLHGPCNTGDQKCWTGTECNLGYQKPFREATDVPDETYPNYEQPANGQFAMKGTLCYNNGHVFPHNRFLILEYRCHINVEISVSIRAVKYLFKYITKGHDQATATIDDEEKDNEILRFLNASFISPPEGKCNHL